MRIRRQRVHWSGKSNRKRSLKAPDAEKVLKKAPSVISVTDEQSNNEWLRRVDIFRPPTAIRTKLGGTYVQESSQCSSQAYLPIISEVLSEGKDKKAMLQPDWNTAQPALGVPIWSSETMQNRPYATDGQQATYEAGTGNFVQNCDKPVAGVPTDVWSL